MYVKIVKSRNMYPEIISYALSATEGRRVLGQVRKQEKGEVVY